jgi:hypothetical protein
MKNPRTLLILLSVAVAGIIGLAVWFSMTLDSHKMELVALRDAHSRAESELADKHAAALNQMAAEHDATVKSLTADFEAKLDGLQKNQREQMASAFKEFENIFDGNKRTIDYINALESKVKAGQAVSKGEVEKLALIATGISFLQKEYQKPFTEFRALEDYLAKQAATAPQAKPQSSFGFFKRMFDKDFREAEKEYYRNEGARQAFTSAQQKFSSVYSQAQSQMAAVSLNGDAQVKKLYQLIEDKSAANQEDLSQFFDQARKALKTHQEVLDFAPTPRPDTGLKVQP